MAELSMQSWQMPNCPSASELKGMPARIRTKFKGDRAAPTVTQ
jgi:hypothetical protein